MPLKSKTRISILFALFVVSVLLLFAVIKFNFQVPYLEDIEPSDSPGEGRAWCDTIKLEPPYAREVEFSAYIPSAQGDERFPVIIYIGGHNIRPKWITRGGWATFADQHRFAIVGPFFFTTHDEWRQRKSYHYPSVWSGRALDKILRKLKQSAPIDSEQLYLFGFSAGAQFAHRYALYKPEHVRAVAAHAAGVYRPPSRYIPTRFLLTVGTLDKDRLKDPRMFTVIARRLKIDAHLLLIPEHDHRICPQQLEASRSLFIETRHSFNKMESKILM